MACGDEAVTPEWALLARLSFLALVIRNWPQDGRDKWQAASWPACRDGQVAKGLGLGFLLVLYLGSRGGGLTCVHTCLAGLTHKFLDSSLLLASCCPRPHGCCGSRPTYPAWSRREPW